MSHTLKSCKALFLTEKALAGLTFVKRKDRRNMQKKISTSRRVTRNSSKKTVKETKDPSSTLSTEIYGSVACFFSKRKK